MRMSDNAKGKVIQTLGLIVAGCALLTAQYPIMQRVFRDLVREELRAYESKFESQVRWDGHKAEVAEIRLRYDAEIAEIKRRLIIIEAARAARMQNQ